MVDKVIFSLVAAITVALIVGRDQSPSPPSKPIPYPVSPYGHQFGSRPRGLTYSEQFKRHYELGKKPHPTREEIKEYLLLDGRLSVQEGLMTERDYEEWTGESY